MSLPLGTLLLTLINPQRLKGAIDSRIAEEQARQRATHSPPARSSLEARRSSSRTQSPSKRIPRNKGQSEKEGDPPGKGPDPSEFEPEFVIEDDSQPSRIGTPKPTQGSDGDATGEGELVEKAPQVEDGEVQEIAPGNAPSSPFLELPLEVRTKLRKLGKLESRYQGKIYNGLREDLY